MSLVCIKASIRNTMFTDTFFKGIIQLQERTGKYFMSRADEIFIQNCKDILTNGIWDTDREVRPRWDDGTPAHTVKKFCIVNRYDLTKEFPNIKSIIHNINEGKTNMILGNKENCIYGKSYIEDTLCGLKFRISSKSFYQVNPIQAYTTEGYELFDDLLDRIDNNIALFLLKSEVKQNLERKQVEKPIATNDGKETSKKQPKKVSKIGRNEPCVCGSGKKYKQCCGK